MDQIGVVYLLLTVSSFDALAFVRSGQLCGKLMERKSQLPAYGFNPLGQPGWCFTDVSCQLFVDAAGGVVRAVLCDIAFLFCQSRNSSSSMGHCIGGPDDSCLAVNPLWNNIYFPTSRWTSVTVQRQLMLIRAAGHY